MKRNLTTLAVVALTVAAIVYVNRFEPNRAAEEERLNQALEALERAAPPPGDTSDGRAFFKRNAERENVEVLPSGLQFEIVEAGTGEKIQPYHFIKGHYVGTFLNGNEFHNTYKDGAPLESPPEGPIEGLAEGLKLMSAGDKWRFFIPPTLAFGENGLGLIVPPDTMVIYDVEILEISGVDEQLRDTITSQDAIHVALKELETKNKEFLAASSMEEGVIVTPSGLQYTVIREGAGDIPKLTDEVSVHYRGTFMNDVEFDNSFARGVPTIFGVNRVVPGWIEALQMMREGSRWRLVLPPELAYGERGLPPRIPPNAVLIFEVELIEIVQ